MIFGSQSRNVENTSTNTGKYIYIYILRGYMSNLSNILAKYKPQNFSYLKSATIFSLFALFLVFIDAQDLEAECNGDCSSTPWTYSSDAEQIYLHIDGGCDILISYRYKECLVGGVIRRDLQITSMKMSASCSGMTENQIMHEAIKRMLWNSHSIFNVIGHTFDVNIISQNCWEKKIVSGILRFLPCDSTYCCVTTDTIVKTDYNYKIVRSGTTPATDSTCFRPVGGGCGSYICNAQFIPYNVPLKDDHDYGCGSTCTTEWLNQPMYIDHIVSANCTIRGYYTYRFCDGVMEIDLYQINRIGSNCSMILTDIVKRLIERLAYNVSINYSPIPNIKFIIKSCWNKNNPIIYPCTFDVCCTAEYEWGLISYPNYGFIKINSTTNICTPLPIGCSSILCGGALENLISLRSSKITIDEINNINDNTILLELFPNPVGDQINIKNNLTKDDKIHYLISDLIGNILISGIIIDISSNIININTSKLLNNQIYNLYLLNSKGIIIGYGKFIK